MADPRRDGADLSNTARQAEYYAGGTIDPEFETNRPHGEGRLYRYLMDFKFERVTQLIGRDLTGLSVLAVCCGSGMDLEYLVRAGARVVGLDISRACLARARIRSQRYGIDYELLQGDAEHLPFTDRAFDYVFVHDGLHHLHEPEVAVREMARVGRLGIVISEPALAAVTRIPTSLGLMRAYEDAGNYINRLDAQRLNQLLMSLGFPRIRATRFLVKYGHPPARWWRIFDNAATFAATKAIFIAFGVAVFGRWGNKLIMVGEAADRPAESEARLVATG